MQLKLTSSLIALSVIVTGALGQTVTYLAYASTVSCTGTTLGCTYPDGRCCTIPTGYGFSLSFENLPAGSQGRGYTDGSCSGFLSEVFGPGDKCWSGGGHSRAKSLNWFRSTREALNPTAEGENEEGSGTDCVEPSFFKYELDDGTIKTIKVPVEKGSAQKIVDLHQANDFLALATYEDY